MVLMYDIPCSVSECYERMLSPHLPAEDEFNPARVELKEITRSRIYLVYKGRRFSRDRRTEYTIDLYSADSREYPTRIVITFVRELFGLPIPMTSTQEIDTFIQERLGACRKL